MMTDTDELDAGTTAGTGTDTDELDAGTDADELDAGTDADELDAGTDADELDAGTDADDADDPDDADELDAGTVAKLRTEAAKYRRRLRAAEARADELARALWAERVAGVGKLADPGDLDYDAELLDDPAAIGAAVDELLTRRPHLRRRRAAGDIGQAAGGAVDAFSLTSLMAGR